MKANLKFWTALLCAGIVLGGCCDDPIAPEVPDTGDDDNPPVEQPEKPLTDGSLFTVQLNDDIMATVGTNAWNAISYKSGKYIAIGDNGSVASSQNGDTWSSKKVGSSNWKSFGEYSDSGGLILGENGMVALVNDLVPYQLGTNKWNASEYYRQTQTSIEYFIVGDNGAIYRNSTSTLDASKVATFGSSDWKGVKMVKQSGKYVAIVVGTGGYIGTLYDKDDWSQERVGTSDWNGIFSCGFSYSSSLIAFGDNGMVAKSTNNGSSWTTINVGSVNWNAATIYSRGIYDGAALFGNNGYIATSANGSDWSTLKVDNLNCNWVKCEYIQSDRIILALSEPDSTGNVYMAFSKYPFEEWSAQKLSAKNLNCFCVMQ